MYLLVAADECAPLAGASDSRQSGDGCRQERALSPGPLIVRCCLAGQCLVHRRVRETYNRQPPASPQRPRLCLESRGDQRERRTHGRQEPAWGLREVLKASFPAGRPVPCGSSVPFWTPHSPLDAPSPSGHPSGHPVPLWTSHPLWTPPPPSGHPVPLWTPGDTPRDTLHLLVGVRCLCLVPEGTSSVPVIRACAAGQVLGVGEVTSWWTCHGAEVEPGQCRGCPQARPAHAPSACALSALTRCSGTLTRRAALTSCPWAGRRGRVSVLPGASRRTGGPGPPAHLEGLVAFPCTGRSRPRIVMCGRDRLFKKQDPSLQAAGPEFLGKGLAPGVRWHQPHTVLTTDAGRGVDGAHKLPGRRVPACGSDLALSTQHSHRLSLSGGGGGAERLSTEHLLHSFRLNQPLLIKI